MKSHQYLVLIGIFLVLATGLFAMGGCTSGSSFENATPIANAGQDQTVETGSDVMLDGSVSRDPDGYISTYKWVFSSRPSGSSTNLTNDSVSNPSFRPDLDGQYVLTLRVFDGTVQSAPDSVTITAVNVPPVADAGSDQIILNTSLVTLDGGSSTDANGDNLTYLWSFDSVPIGSAFSAGDNPIKPDTADPSFTPDAVGNFVLSLIVNDGQTNSTPDLVTIISTNNAPVAHAGDDQRVATLGMVNLDGGASHDADGDSFTFFWSFTSVPGGSSFNAGDNPTNPDTTNPFFTPDFNGDYILSLVVDDGTVVSLPDMVVITAGNTVAQAGFDQVVETGSLVNLDGSGSFDSGALPLTHFWSFTSVPAGSSLTNADLSNRAAINTDFIPDVQGNYTLSLFVDNGTGGTDTDTVTITASVLLSNLTFNDTNLASCVSSKAEDYVVELTDLNCYLTSGITDLGGIENLISLISLHLSHNDIADISPLASLTGLEILHLTDSNIADISSLAALTSLTDLNLNRNNISDISILAGLANLTDLILSNNSITTVPNLSGLTSITDLHLSGNTIVDISGLAGLPASLSVLYLSFNDIIDISSLANLSGLTLLHLYDNDLTAIPYMPGLTNLTHLYLGSNSLTDITGLSVLLNLTRLHLDSNSISDLNILAVLTGLVDLNLSYNNVTDISALSGLTNLTKLQLHFNGVSVLTDLTGLISLTHLRLNNNNIGDVSSLAGLVNLDTLYLNNNGIGDISSLESLTNLQLLYLGGNSISDITDLANLTALLLLDVGSNDVVDVAALAGLTSLIELHLYDNTIVDVSDLDGLTSLVTLNLPYNAITTGVADLITLVNATNIALTGNDAIPCVDLDILEAALPGVVIRPIGCS